MLWENPGARARATTQFLEIRAPDNNNNRASSRARAGDGFEEAGLVPGNRASRRVAAGEARATK